MAPTVVTSPSTDEPGTREELIHSVLLTQRADDDDEAVALAITTCKEFDCSSPLRRVGTGERNCGKRSRQVLENSTEIKSALERQKQAC